MLLPYVNCFKLLFFPHFNLHSIHHIDKAKTELSQHCISIHKYSTKYLAEVPLQPQVFLFDATNFAHNHLAIICHLSPHLFTSQALSGRMGAGAHFQVSPEIVDWVQAQAVADPLKEIHSVVYKPLLLCA